VVHVPSSPALRLAAAAGLATAALAAGCSSSGSTGAGASPSHAAPVTVKSPGEGASPSHAPPVTMKLTSSAFEDFGAIPKLYTCDGQSISVPLSWSGAPKGTAWLAVTVIDPGGPITHWYVIDIPPATTGIKQGASYPNSTPGKQVTSWLGMCPQGGPDIPDTYQFTVYAMPSSYKPPKTYAGFAQDENALAASADGLAANAIGIGQLTGYYAD
jgi:phosphatidylethanolamine-binding protein (PEBP) family uncharacterized protein